MGNVTKQLLFEEVRRLAEGYNGI